MWTRELLKTRAKEVLRNNYWKALLVSFLIVITGGSHNGGNGGNGAAGGKGITGGILDVFNYKFIMLIVGIVFIIVLIRILIGYVLEVG
ncbi:MAG TPA: hypothetical protein VJ990_06195, partial [Clostridia bacterium]|nr:hypothetical protein [Clostridia bacterium]